MRRVISERAAAAGIPRPLANPNTVRRSRAIELWREGVPLVVVQRILGHTSANSTAAFLDLSEQDQRRVEKYYFSQDGQREEDNVNTFRGRIEVIEKCERQARIVVSTAGGPQLTVMISSRTLSENRYRVGDAVMVRTKAPWITLSGDDSQVLDEEQNCLHALVERVSRGRTRPRCSWCWTTAGACGPSSAWSRPMSSISSRPRGLGGLHALCLDPEPAGTVTTMPHACANRAGRQRR
jgi:molybdate transport system regulatory protein